MAYHEKKMFLNISQEWGKEFQISGKEQIFNKIIEDNFTKLKKEDTPTQRKYKITKDSRTKKKLTLTCYN